MATKNALVLLVLACLLANATATRDLGVKSGFNVPASLEPKGSLRSCLVGLIEFEFCSAEILLIPFKRHANLSPICCHAITTIATRCWFFASLRMAAKQGNVLHGYCEGVTWPVEGSAAESLVQHPTRDIYLKN